MVWTVWVMFGALLAGLSVGLGAFGSHGLRESLSDHLMGVYEIAVRYQMYHAFALILLGLVAIKVDSFWLKTAGGCFLIGVLAFSGSLYGLIFTEQKFFGPVTPIGGGLLVLGWILFAVAMIRT